MSIVGEDAEAMCGNRLRHDLQGAGFRGLALAIQSFMTFSAVALFGWAQSCRKSFVR